MTFKIPSVLGIPGFGRTYPSALAMASRTSVVVGAIAQDDSLFLSPFQRKDPHLEGIAIHPFKQRRIAASVDDPVEYLTSVFALGHPSLHELALDVHRQPRKGCIRWQRKIER